MGDGAGLHGPVPFVGEPLYVEFGDGHPQKTLGLRSPVYPVPTLESGSLSPSVA